MAAKSSNEFVTRGEAIEFAQRTRKNLEYVKGAFDAGEDLQVVTQLVNSLLGIVVVPKEQYFEESFLCVDLNELYKDRQFPSVLALHRAEQPSSARRGGSGRCNMPAKHSCTRSIPSSRRATSTTSSLPTSTTTTQHGTTARILPFPNLRL